MRNDLISDDEDLALKEGPQYLLFYLRATLFALRAEDIAEIVELPNITTVPWMQTSVKGVCNIRGSVIGVVDTARTLMDKDCEISKKSSLIIVNKSYANKNEKIGLIVDEVFEIEVFIDQDMQEIPKHGLSVNAKFVESIISYEKKFIPLLDLNSIVDIDALSKRVNDEN